MQPDVPLTSEPQPRAALLPRLELRVGFRDQLIKDESFDPFSEDDQLPAFQLAAGVRLHELESGSALAGVASLELGGTSASLRGLPTALDVLRIGLGPELRLPVAERLYVSGRVSPQAVRVSTRLEQAQFAGLSFSDTQWTLGVDASIAADLRIAQVHPAGLPQPLGLFLRIEAGYAWSPSLELELAPENGPVRSAPLPLGELALHGLSFGASLGVGY